jgi:hypothetical protein
MTDDCSGNRPFKASNFGGKIIQKVEFSVTSIVKHCELKCSVALVL